MVNDTEANTEESIRRNYDRDIVAPPGQFRRERNWTRSARRGRAMDGAHQTRRTTENTNIDLRFRHGETPEGLPGSLAPGMGKEKRQELERSHRFPGASTRYADIEPREGKPGNGSRPKPKSNLRPGTPCQPYRRRAEGRWEVRLAHSTRRRESRSQGEGASRVTQPAKET